MKKVNKEEWYCYNCKKKTQALEIRRLNDGTFTARCKKCWRQIFQRDKPLKHLHHKQNSKPNSNLNKTDYAYYLK